MLLFFVTPELLKAEQLALFPTLIAGSIRKDGTVIKPHTGMRRKRVVQVHAGKRPFTPDLFDAVKPKGVTGDLFGGKPAAAKPAKKPASVVAIKPKEKPANPSGDLFDEAEKPAREKEKFVTPPKLDLPTIELDGDTWYIVNTGRAEGGKVIAHLSSATRGRPAANGVQPVQRWADIEMPAAPALKDKPTLVEHVTGKGKTLRGIVRKDITKEQAKQIDPYTFHKDGGWFIREKHLDEAPAAAEISDEHAKTIALMQSLKPGDIVIGENILPTNKNNYNVVMAPAGKTSGGEFSIKIRPIWDAKGNHPGHMNSRYPMRKVSPEEWAEVAREHDESMAQMLAERQAKEEKPAAPAADLFQEEVPKEGDTRYLAGKEYKLIDGRWHRIGEENEWQPEGWAEDEERKAVVAASRASVMAAYDKPAPELKVGQTFVFNHGDLSGKVVFRITGLSDQDSGSVRVSYRHVNGRKTGVDAAAYFKRVDGQWITDHGEHLEHMLQVIPEDEVDFNGEWTKTPWDRTRDHVFPIKESADRKKLRLGRGLKYVVKVPAKLFRELWEKQHGGESLPWNSPRTDNLVNITKEGEVDAYPEVGIKNGQLDVADGRHRISLAADRDQDIEVAVATKTERSELTHLFYEMQKQAREAAPAPAEEAPAEQSDALGGVDYSLPFEQIHIAPFGVQAGITKGQRSRLNAQAEAVLNKETGFTEEDKAILRQYSGNGGNGDSMNEYYTDPKVAAAMWKVLHGMGMTTGAALEPSCGTGVFLHTAPRGVRLQGVEMSPISATIAGILHGQYAHINNSSMETFSNRVDAQYSVVIGNVPFGIRGATIKDDKPERKTAQTYFVDASLDKLEPGGIAALIVPTNIMDANGNRKFREDMLRKAEFIGALRMPNTAFEHSHTEVTSDIVFFRKRPQDVSGALGTVSQDTLKALGLWDEDFLAGTYFTDGRGKANVLGSLEAGWRAKYGKGNDIIVTGSMDGVPEAIAAYTPEAAKSVSMGDILEALGDDEDARRKAISASMVRPNDRYKVGDTKEVDGVMYILMGKPPRWHRVDEFMESPEIQAARELAGDIQNAMNGQYAEGLAERVRAYVDAHGNPGSNKTLLLAANQDKTLYRLVGAVKPDGSLSDVVEHRAVKAVAGAFDTLAQSLALEHETFKADTLAARAGMDVEEALDHLYASSSYCQDPVTGSWTTADQYLAGSMWPKLDAVKAVLAKPDIEPHLKEKYALQAKMLEEAIDALPLEDADFQINSAFIPTEIVAAFFNERKNSNEHGRGMDDLVITYNRGLYTIEGGSYLVRPLLEKYLNRTGVRRDDMPEIAQWNEDFKAWLCKSPDYRERVEDLYNRKFRGFRQAAFSDQPFAIPGLALDELNHYHYAGLRWAMAAGKGIIAADVGLGKTVRALSLARLAKANGTAKKPLFVVPKSVLANWQAEAERFFPGSRILVIGETYGTDKEGNLVSKVDDADTRNRKLHDLTQNDYDFVFMSKPVFDTIDLDPITKENFVQDDFWAQRGEQLGHAGDKRRKKIRESFNQAMADRDFRRRTGAIYFNDLGVDLLIGDEAHSYKNLYAAKSRFGDSPKFLGGQGLSDTALDMNLKARWVREQNQGKGIFMLTATPTKNSPLEVYSMLSHIAPEAFENLGIRNSEEFLDRFCHFVEDKVLTTSGEIEDAVVTAGFKNLDGLRHIMQQYIDRKTAEDVGLVLPKRDDRMHLVDMSEEQKEVYEELRARAEKEAEKDAGGDAHIFRIMSEMGKAALDLELYDATKFAGHVSPKLKEAVKHIKAGAKEGGQVVFVDSNDSHEKLASLLVKAGFKRSEIGIINADAAKSSAQRQNLADKFNAGKIKVIIGNTATMGEGINLQVGTTDIHHLDIPWEPASIQQRNGRGLRQGNTKEAVRIHSYLSKGSFDGYRYQSMSAKKDWQDLLWNGGDKVENLARSGKVARDEMMILLAADPDMARTQFESDKKAAMERYAAGQRVEAAEAFVRFQELKANYGALKNKDTKTGALLRRNLDKAKAALSKNQYFTAKAALDHNELTLVQPNSGQAYHAGVGVDFPHAEDSPVPEGGQFVVTGVNVPNRTVSLRQYGVANARTVRVPLKMLDSIEHFQYDEAAEKTAIKAALEEAARSKAGQVEDIKTILDLPHDILRESHDSIQKQLKESFKGYKWQYGYGVAVPMLDKAGKPVAKRDYDAKDALEDHDLMLPLPEHKEKAIQGYIENARGRTFHEKSHHNKRGREVSSWIEAQYPGEKSFDHSHTNKWEGDATKKLFGEGFAKEAHARFHEEQLARVEKAPNFHDALKDVEPLVDYEYNHGGQRQMKWPHKLLGMLWRKAKEQGILDDKFNAHMPVEHHTSPHSERGWDTPMISHHVLRPGERTIRDVLHSLAQAGSHHGLRAAMVTDSERPAADKLKDLAQEHYHHPEAYLPAIEHLIAKNPELGNMKMRELHKLAGHGNWDHNFDIDKKAREVFGQDAGDMPLSQAIADYKEKHKDD